MVGRRECCSIDDVDIPFDPISIVQHNRKMEQNLSEWLEAQTGDTRRRMALNLGWVPSTFNRNLSRPDLIIEICKYYKIDPLEGLIQAGVVDLEWVAKRVETMSLKNVSESALLDELKRRALDREPRRAQSATYPEYINLSEQDAINYGLAAKKRDNKIDEADLPGHP